MNALMNVNQVLTMSSREIAELVEARHNDVVATIDRLFSKGLLRSSRKTRREETGGRPIEVYDLTERDTHLVVSGYSDEHRARVIDRWQELESAVVQPQGFVIPKSMSEALRLAADLSEQNERLSIELDTAVRTKAEIGSRREATAMATASAKAKEVAKLQHELGRNQQHATVIAVEKATDRKFGKSGFVPLRRVTKKYGLTAVDVMDPRWGTAKAWPAIAWREAYGIELGDLFDASEAA